MKYLAFILLVAAACTDSASEDSINPTAKTTVSNASLFKTDVLLDFGILESVTNATSQCVEFKITSDSRCPANVVCIWQGEVTAKITFKEKNRNIVTIILQPGDSTEVVINHKRFSVQLVSVLPYPADGPIAEDDYRIILEITPL